MDNRSDGVRRDTGVYAFDLKVNVDFNSGHMSLNLPNNAPFAKKNVHPLQHPQYIAVPPHMQYQYIPINNEANSRIPLTNPPPQPPLPIPHQQSSPSLYNPKHFESLNTTSLRHQAPPEGVQCVICQKVIREQSFSMHLQEHRNRNKARGRNSISSSEVSIRNKDDEAEIVEMVNQYPQSYSQIPNSLNFSNSNIPYSNHHGVSYSSNTVTIPLIQESAPLYYQHSPQTHRIYQQYPQNNVSQTSSFHLSQTGLGYPQPINPNSFSVNGSQPSSRHSYQGVQVVNGGNPLPKDLNIHQFHRIQSMIIRPQVARVQRGLQDCGQSAISRNSQPTRFSQIHAIEGQLQLRPNHQQSSSSDEQSLKAYPSKSVRSNLPSGHPSIRSTYTEKLTKTKLPVNYLAREQFITSSTSNTRKSNALS